jgi:hypothetical protein
LAEELERPPDDLAAPASAERRDFDADK